jgi:hypothetical protein
MSGNLKAASHDADQKAAEVPDYLARLERQADDLSDRVQAILDRLATVLAPESPAAGEAAGLKACGPSSPLAISLSELLDRNGHNIGRLSNALHRLQI